MYFDIRRQPGICRCLIAAAVFCCGVIYGQTISSSIGGLVSDPSGAPVSGVTITITNSETGAVNTAVTDASGTYSVPALLAGLYSVTAAKPDFATYKATGIRLYSAQTARIDITLKVGSVKQEVTVASQTPLVQTDSMGVSSSISTPQLQNLPTSLQTVDAFIALAPGVQAPGDATNPPIGGGTHWGSVNFTLNGAEINDPGNSGAVTVQGVGLLVLPPPSSIQELKVQANNMTAESRGKSAVTLVTKAGSNAFHFEAYEYLQNTDLNANSFLLNATGEPRAANRLNQFGGNVSGPVLRDKLFFFGDYSGYRHRNTPISQLTLPSMAMRQGDFSALCSTFGAGGICAKGTQLYNPFNGQPFVNNQIPSNLITPQTKTLLTYLPAPTVADSPGLPFGSPNYISTIPNVQDADSTDIRADYDMSNTDRLFGVYAQRVASPWNSANANYPDNYGQGRYAYNNFTASLSETHTFNATTVNQLRLAWGDYGTKFSGQNQDLDPTSLFPQMPESYYRGLPTLTMSGYTGMFHDYGTGYWTPRWDIQITDDLTHVHGRHTIQAGIDETGYKMSSRVPSTGNATGAFAFNGHWTGNAGWPDLPQSGGNSFADFLLGVANSSTTPGVGKFSSMVYSRDWGLYVQDTWRVSSKLTLNYGLRYEYQSPWKYRSQQEVATFDTDRSMLVLPQNSSTPTLPPGASADMFAAYPFETTQSIGLPLDYVQGDKNNFAPRVGIAYRPFGGANTVIRAGYGVYYNFQPGFVGSRADAWNPPYLLSRSQTFTSRLPGKPKTPYLPDITFVNPFPSASAGSLVSPNPQIYLFQQDFKDAVTQEWNLTLEHQWGQDWLTRASYIGNQAHHLPWNFGPINTPLVQVPNVPLQQQRPFQPWGPISATRSGGKQNFSQLQFEGMKRFSHGMSFQLEYQYTRSLDDVPTSGGPQIWQYPDLDYGNTVGLRRHWLVFNYIYQLPIGRGRAFLAHAPRFVDALVGGWQVSGISTYGTGTPFSVSFSQTGTGIVGWWGGRADVVAGAPLYAGQQSGSHDIVSGVQWYNPAAFTAPAKWEWGNSARDMMFGPGMWNWDISGAKSFKPTERLQLQVRADLLSAFNHFNLGNPGATIADTRDGGTAVPLAGKITGGSGSRIVQLSLKLMY
ncbi:MAG TPA: TonB-dependent receptor [Bryobacteraceae bacterium]|nr:TonB-dependent receptor [Bryobacteraceae bacterium]